MLRKLVPPLVAAAALGGAVAAPAAAQGLDQTCALSLTAFDPGLINIAFPDDSARYYAGVAPAIPGTRVRLTGRFPHARYMSFNAYDAALRPVAALNDVAISPDPGSTNPFVAGADRTAARRSYTAFMEPGDPATTPARPNTMVVPAGRTFTFLYRIYIPDDGRDQYGDAGLPTATLEPAGAAGTPVPPSACAGLERPSVTGVNELLGQLATPVDGPPTTGANPPVWRKFVNLLSSVTINVTGQPGLGPLDLDQLGGSGGFLSNRDNAYVSTPTNRGHSRVLLTQVRAPTFPDTRSGARTMPGGQLRYWSMCSNDPVTQRFVGCANDDRTPTRDGVATFVVSPPGDRPANATSRCGIAWLPWGPNPRGVLIYRHMLPDASFTQSVQAATEDREAATMGDHLPASRYVSRAEVEALGCPQATEPAPAATARACTSRRKVTLTLPRSVTARTVRVRVGGRTRTVRVRPGRKVTVDLRGLRRGRHAVRITSRGKAVVRRTYRTCTKRA